MDNLTNDAKFLLSSMYKIYVERRKNSELKRNATNFISVENIHETIMPEWHEEDVKSTCFELKKHGLISGTNASNSIVFIHLTTEAIAIMENQFKDKIDTVLDYANKIKGAIPFI